MHFSSKLLCLLSLCLASLNIIAQNKNTGSISGKIVDNTKQPIIGVTVRLEGTTIGAASDVNGKYEINNIPVGKYDLEASAIGYQKQGVQVKINRGQNLKIDFEIEVDIQQLEEVYVEGKSEAAQISELPIQIASIDLAKLQSESADVVGVLDRTSGVRVRQSGGLGSNTTVQLNGLTGLAVRTYYDGIPLELLGGGIQLNNIPVNTVERIDVYKGVMPIDVGTDALAGGINVISKKVDYDYLDASYQFGSFNTHIGTFNGAKKLGNHFYVAVSSFFNYSDNNYRIRASQRTPDFKEIEVEVERFHSAHQSSMLQGTVGLVDTKWADKLTYEVSYNQRFDEIQHGVRIGNKAVGEANLERNVLIQNLRYKKRFFNEQLTLDYFGNFSISNENVEDSTTNVYDWFGNVVATNRQGMEVLGLPSLREGQTTSQIHRVNLSYAFNPSHTLKISSFLSDQDIEGKDPIAPTINGVDPNTIPSFLTRSISGISYESKWFDSKLETVLFGKYYYYNQSTTDIRSVGGDRIFEFEASGRQTGYGLGLKYAIIQDLFLRVSYERALRVPTKDEVFGNFLTIEPNFFLKPEESNNLNIGGFFKHKFNLNQYISIDASWFLRDQTNLIRLEPGRNENDPAQFINEAEASATGVELSLKVAPIKNLDLSFSYTYQDIVKGGEKDLNNTNGVGNPIPNIPSTFFNASARYSFVSPFSANDDIVVFGYYTFVDEFNLIFQTTRNEENIIPTQRQLDFGLTYNLKNSGLNLSFQMNNILDAEVFDNFRVPKPGRNFNIKIRYMLNKSIL